MTMRLHRWMLTALLMLAGATAWLEPQARPSLVGGHPDATGVGSAGASPPSSPSPLRESRAGHDGSASLAPGALGTRGDTPLRTATPSGGGYAWLQMTLALVLVAVGLRYGLPRLIGWAGKAGVGSRLDGEIRLLESRAVPGGSLLMVKARDRLLLIGATPQGMQLLADLTAQSEWHAHLGQDAQATTPLAPRGQDAQATTGIAPSFSSGGFEQILHRAVSTEQRGTVARGTIATDLQQEAASELRAHMAQARACLSRLAKGGTKGEV
ncbi:MAG: flagellar biosynthetic protein FliO [Fimbriimonadales bacterium]|nr:flagellar biosynthetic protein FliO [Fimbriimonadales bacterium]